MGYYQAAPYNPYYQCRFSPCKRMLTNRRAGTEPWVPAILPTCCSRRKLVRPTYTAATTTTTCSDPAGQQAISGAGSFAIRRSIPVPILRFRRPVVSECRSIRRLETPRWSATESSARFIPISRFRRRSTQLPWRQRRSRCFDRISTSGFYSG